MPHLPLEGRLSSMVANGDAAGGYESQPLHDLAQNRYFDDRAFLGYLKYLLYWKQPEYAKYVMYPHAFLSWIYFKVQIFGQPCPILQTKRLLIVNSIWKHYWNNRLKQILPRPLPEMPAPPPPPPAPTLAAAPTKPEGSTRAGAGERRKRKHANS